MLRRLSIVLALAVPALSCQDYRFEQKCPEVIKEQEITRAAAKPRPADILFVVDNSGSMADEQENLAANFNAFIDSIAGPENDYRIAVVTTDQSKGNDGSDRLEWAGLRDQVFVTEPGTGVEAFVSQGQGTCVQTDIPTGCFRGPNANTRVIDSTVLDEAQQIATFIDNVKVGSCGSGLEEGLSAMLDSLGKANGCNDGFLRDEANLVIILVSDENDGSRDPADRNRSLAVAQAVESLKNIKPISQIRVAAIVGAVDGQPSNCSNAFGASCGSLCTEPGPQASSGAMCNAMTAPAVCQPHEGCSGGMCASEPFRNWNETPGSCLWCSYFKADDCCSALAGNRYTEFARAIESELNQIDPVFAQVGCTGENPTPGEPFQTACLIDSICQDSFAATLQRIAQDLVFNASFTIEPPAVNPEGLRVRIKGGRWPDGILLEPGTDYDATATSVNLKGDKIPGPDEDIEIFYVSEVIDSSSMPRGACGIDM